MRRLKAFLCWILGHRTEPWKQVGWAPKRVGRKLEFFPIYSRSAFCLRCKEDAHS